MNNFIGIICILFATTSISIFFDFDLAKKMPVIYLENNSYYLYLFNNYYLKDFAFMSFSLFGLLGLYFLLNKKELAK